MQLMCQMMQPVGAIRPKLTCQFGFWEILTFKGSHCFPLPEPQNKKTAMANIVNKIVKAQMHFWAE